VDRAYGPVDQERWRFMVDSRCRAAKSSPEQVLASVVGPDCSRRVGKKVEEALGFLTEGLTGRCDIKVRPAAMNQGGVALELGGEDGGALYRARWRGEGSGRESSDRRWVFIAVGLKPKRRGRGDARALIYEGKRGGTCGTSARLHMSVKRWLMVARDTEN
jgi:hypothetical protein